MDDATDPPRAPAAEPPEPRRDSSAHDPTAGYESPVAEVRGEGPLDDAPGRNPTDRVRAAELVRRLQGELDQLAASVDDRSALETSWQRAAGIQRTLGELLELPACEHVHGRPGAPKSGPGATTAMAGGGGDAE